LALYYNGSVDNVNVDNGNALSSFTQWIYKLNTIAIG